MRTLAALLAGAALCAGPEPSAEAEAAARWGSRGHEMAARTAAEILPGDVPAFFRDATDQLTWLGPEPDRWRVFSRPALNVGAQHDHCIDLESVPDGARDAADRFTFIRRLHGAGIERPEQMGFLPYRIVELHDRLTETWRRWRATPEGSPERRWLEERIVSDAGILGHYVADGAQPHHTTVHYDGWAAGVPNPEDYTTERGFHVRFEGPFVEAHVSLDDVRERLPVEASLPPAGPAGRGVTRGLVLAYLERSHDHVEELYRIDRDHGFDPDRPAAPEAHAFAADRLAAGAEMLAALWLSAWRDSAG